jgi:hypothetical protein
MNGYAVPPLCLKLHDPDVQHTFLHNLDCEVFSEAADVRLRVMRGRDPEDRVFLVVEDVASGAELDGVLLDKNQARILWKNVVKAIGSLKLGHSIVLKGRQFSVGEARRLVTALAAFTEE